MRMMPPAVLLLTLLYPSDSSGQWVIEVLGPIDGRPTGATAINNRGDVVGYGFDESGSSIPFLWTRKEGFRKILGPAVGAAVDINNRGDVLGFYSPHGAFTQSHGFLWSSSAGLVDLGIGVSPQRVNDAGVIAGRCGVPNPDAACLWAHGIETLLQAPFPGGAVLALNNRGDVAGYVADPHGPGEREQPVVWPKGGEAQILPTPSGAFDAHASALNNRGLIVGSGWFPFDVPFRRKPLAWDARGTLLPGLEDVTGVATAVNARGMIVGSTPGLRLEDSRAFVWMARGGITLLPGGDASAAADINDAGDIAGVVYTNQGSYAAVWRHRPSARP